MSARAADAARARRMRSLARRAWRGANQPGRPRLRRLDEIPLAERRRLEAKAWASIGDGGVMGSYLGEARRPTQQNLARARQLHPYRWSARLPMWGTR